MDSLQFLGLNMLERAQRALRTTVPYWHLIPKS